MVKHKRFRRARAVSLDFGENVVEIVKRLYLRVDDSRLVSALNGSDYRHALFVLLGGVKLDARRDAEYRGLIAVCGGKSKVTLAARYHKTDVAVLEVVYGAGLFDHLRKFCFAHGDIKSNGFCRRENAVDMLLKAENSAGVSAYPLENAVAVKHAVVENRNFGVVAFHKFSV